jgi:hypothetical protein
MDFEFLRQKPSVAYVWANASRRCPIKGFGLYSGNYHLRDNSHGERGQRAYETVVTPSKLPEFYSIEGSGHDLYVDSGIGERVITSPLVRPARTDKQLRDTKTQVPRLLGLGHRTILTQKQVEVPVPAQLIKLGEVDGSTNTDNAYVVGYSILSRSAQLSRLYRDSHGRPGRTLTVASVISGEEALDLTRGLQENPRSARQFAEFVLRECVGISEEEVTMPDYSRIDPVVSFIQFAPSVSTPPSEGLLVPII